MTIAATLSRGTAQPHVWRVNGFEALLETETSVEKIGLVREHPSDLLLIQVRPDNDNDNTMIISNASQFVNNFLFMNLF